MTDDEGAGGRQKPLSAQAPEDKAALLREREAGLHSWQDSLALRSQAMEARLAAREAALLERESENEDLRLANQKLVMATLAAQELREAAQMARRRQDEFLAMLSHELRNPLAPISSAVAVLAQLNGKPIPGKLLDIVRRQVKHLTRLVDDLLDASRITEGKVVLQRRITPVQDFVRHAIETCRDGVESRKQRLVADLPSEAVNVNGDPDRLVQAITNLVQNASKYSPDGGDIEITVSTEGEEVEIAVRDSGAGITAEALPHIFDLFVQDERPLSRSQGGLGIGLTIVRRMVEMHGGTVEARSRGRDMGSEFIVCLPIAQERSKAGSRTRAEALASVSTRARILIVEDNVDAGDLLAELLRLSGHEVEVALDGPSGLERFEEVRPQVVLCDIGLPGLDGYEVAAKMRKSPYEPRPTLIAVTGYGGPANVERALAAGFDYHVVKPVDPEAVLRLVNEAARIGPSAAYEPESLTSHGSLRDDGGTEPTSRPAPLAPD